MTSLKTNYLKYKQSKKNFKNMSLERKLEIMKYKGIISRDCVLSKLMGYIINQRHIKIINDNNNDI